jgi:DNA-binding Xre family transcriptional regulator
MLPPKAMAIFGKQKALSITSMDILNTLRMLVQKPILLTKRTKLLPESGSSLLRSEKSLLGRAMDLTIRLISTTNPSMVVLWRPMPRSKRADPDAVRFGEILQRERLARGWTIRKLAQRSGMNAQYLGVVEAGGNVPSLSTILEVCEVLGVDAGALIREVAEARRMPRAMTS